MIVDLSRANAPLRRVPSSAIYVVSAFWAAWLFYLAATGGLGVEPIEALEHRYGLLALQMLIAVLAITPLRQFTGLSLLRFRRALGVSAFGFVLAHFLVWAILDVGTWDAIAADIIKRPYVTLGMAGFILLIPLALTSNDYALRRLGAIRWRRLHQLGYLATLFAAVHFIWLVKGLQFEPLIYTAILLFLLSLRLRSRKSRAA
ncbi:protein-methionine-sulfoxide reductase heme-binding subunit MsrQ [Rhodobacteraceae bacterium XHP0102]|nr:protein-methionine-sulfoxide reductase heme-binding subunit MsrQ [Rhodobacteraceae bacterium XHP0102]